MTDAFEYSARSGNSLLSLATFAGLALLTAQLWGVIPGFVLLLMLPALAITFAQMIILPAWGLRINQATLQIRAGRQDISVPVSRIAYLSVEDGVRDTRVILVLDDGEYIDLPQQALPDPITLIREATSRGIPVRHS